MPRVEFELTIPVFERAKTVHALESATTEIGSHVITLINKCLPVDVWLFRYIQSASGFFYTSKPQSASSLMTARPFLQTYQLAFRRALLSHLPLEVCASERKPI
jgi:hypothetical protein